MKFSTGNERGAVALISVLLSSILIIMIAVGAARLMVGELRQAQDAENGIIAYGAANSAVEEAVAAVIAKLKTAQPLSSLNQSCSNDNFGSAPTNSGTTQFSTDTKEPVQITCRQIITSGPVRNKLGRRDQADQYDLSGAAGGVKNISLSWSATPKAGAFSLPATGSIAAVRDGQPWPNGAPVPMEVVVTSYDSVAANGDVRVRTVILQPVAGSAANTVNVATALGAPEVKCSANGTQDCKVSLVGFDPSRSYVVRIKPRFGDAVYNLVPIQNTGNSEYELNLQKAHVDVTARVGSSLRRITRDIPIRTGAFAGLDTVLYGDVDLCKNLQIFTGGSYSSSDIVSTRPGESTCDLFGSSVLPSIAGTGAEALSLTLNPIAISNGTTATLTGRVSDPTATVTASYRYAGILNGPLGALTPDAAGNITYSQSNLPTGSYEVTVNATNGSTTVSRTVAFTISNLASRNVIRGNNAQAMANDVYSLYSTSNIGQSDLQILMSGYWSAYSDPAGGAYNYVLRYFDIGDYTPNVELRTVQIISGDGNRPQVCIKLEGASVVCATGR